MNSISKALAAAAVSAALVTVPTSFAMAENEPPTDGCYTGWYQGAPIEVCPRPKPDPTNCYTGDYQGAPQEVCMPTGWVPPADWGYAGQPLVMHVSKDYVAPVTVEEQPVIASAPIAAEAPEVKTSALLNADEWEVALAAALAAAG